MLPPWRGVWRAHQGLRVLVEQVTRNIFAKWIGWCRFRADSHRGSAHVRRSDRRLRDWSRRCLVAERYLFGEPESLIFKTHHVVTFIVCKGIRSYRAIKTSSFNIDTRNKIRVSGFPKSSRNTSVWLLLLSFDHQCIVTLSIDFCTTWYSC